MTDWLLGENLWPTALCLSILAWGAHSILWNPNTHYDYREIGLPIVNFALFTATIMSAALILSYIFIAEGPPVMLSRMTAALWFFLTLACTRHLPWRLWARALVAFVLIALPLLAIAYAERRPELRQELVQYRTIVEEQGRSQPPPSLVEVMSFVFVRKPDIACTDSDSACMQIKRRIQARDSIAHLLLRISYWFLAILCVTRYYGRAYQQREEHSRRSTKEYDLKRGVIAQSATVLSVATSLFLALLIGGVNLGQLGVFGGLIAAGVSVALKDTLGNFAAGVVLLWDGTIRKGDVVTIERPENPETGGTYGIVEDVRLRYTLIRDRDTVHRLIPNSVLINSVVENWTHDADRNVRLKVRIPIPYGADLKQVRTVLESSCYEVGRILKHPAPKALVAEFGDSAIIFSLRFFINDPEGGIRSVISDLLSFASQRLADINVQIPYPQLDIHLKKSTEDDRRGAKRSLTALQEQQLRTANSR